VKANGKGVPKVFKLKRVVLPPRRKMELETRISRAVHTTRKPRPGIHGVDVVVNGIAMPAASFEVLGPKTDNESDRGRRGRR
jgi:hypothetical protein